MKKNNVSDLDWENWINPFLEEIVYTGKEAQFIIMFLGNYDWQKSVKQEIKISRKSVSIFIDGKLESENNDYDYLRETLDIDSGRPFNKERYFISERNSQEMLTDLEIREAEFKGLYPDKLEVFWKRCFEKVSERIAKYKIKELKEELNAHIKVLTYIDLKLNPVNGKDNLENKWDSKIFTCEKGFQIFNAFKNEIVTESNEYASYSFLFNQLMKDELIHEMKHMKFITYLNEKHNSKILDTYIQFNSASSKVNRDAYTRHKKAISKGNTSSY